MINYVDFVSASKIEAMAGDPAWAVISITDPGSSDSRISSAFGPVLRLKFDDLDDDSMASGSTGQPFSVADAQTLLSFLGKLDSDLKIDGLLVHCEMGRSRSGAIAWFALSYGGKMANERRIDGYNPLVLSMLENVRSMAVPRPSGMLVAAGFSFSP